jgi:hypothetical protein
LNLLRTSRSGSASSAAGSTPKAGGITAIAYRDPRDRPQKRIGKLGRSIYLPLTAFLMATLDS